MTLVAPFATTVRTLAHQLPRLLAILICLSIEPARAEQVRRLVEGIVWQPDEQTLEPRGSWQRLGARKLLVQWTLVDNRPFLPDLGVAGSFRLPDWARIVREPWAEEIILGLAGEHKEEIARDRGEALAALSKRIAKQLRLPVAAWYFPVEADPTWIDAALMRDWLTQLPRPLWISAYDNSNIGPKPFSNWIKSWLPPDVGIFFQDGVGVGARTPGVAKQYADELVRGLGRHRVRVIVEGFRRKDGGGFQAGSARDLLAQIRTYKGHSLFLFDGPHYISDALVDEILALAEKSR
jgi:hypothetical protein